METDDLETETLQEPQTEDEPVSSIEKIINEEQEMLPTKEPKQVEEKTDYEKYIENYKTPEHWTDTPFDEEVDVEW